MAEPEDKPPSENAHRKEGRSHNSKKERTSLKWMSKAVRKPPKGKNLEHLYIH